MAEGVGPSAGGAGSGERGGGGGGGGEGEAARENWELFSNWASCMCVVTFDLELGQALEVHWHCIYTIHCR